MTQFTPAVEAELSKDTALVAGILKVELPDATIRLLDGAGELVVDGETYVGEDLVFGSLAAVEELTDGIGDEVPALNFVLHPASDAASAELAAPTMQGSLVTLSLAAIDRETGQVIPDALEVFVGELDQPVLSIGKASRELEYNCVSAMERLFENQEGAGLSDSFHQSIWPGETGFADITGIVKTLYWGVHAPRGNMTRVEGGFGGLTGFESMSF